MIIGAKHIIGDFSKLSDIDLYDAMEESIQHVRAQAVANADAIKNTGALSESIFAETIPRKNGARGICWTNSKYADYVEFGTGKKGQENHAGISPMVTPMYRMTPWWIHESDIDRELAEKYGWFHIDTPEGRFYQCTGQPAKPFMYPALQDSTEFIEKIFAEKINEAMK